MRQIDANTLSALAGSRAGEGITVHVWYNGALAYPDPLPVASWGFSWDRSRQIQSFEMTVADKDGKLAPWLLEDPLGVGGSLLQVRWQVGGAGFINMGWYRITKPSPDERWHSYIINDSAVPGGSSVTTLQTSETLVTSGTLATNGGTPQRVTRGPGNKRVMVSGGATVAVQAEDLAVLIKRDRLLAPESPAGGSPTVVGEVKRLLRDIVPVVTMAGVVDRAVNATLIYERDRLDAVQALCKSISCDYRMNGEGQLEVYSILPQAPVVTLRGGPEGLLVKVDREQPSGELYNIFVVDGTATDHPVRAVARIESGPLRAGGPHGNVPTFYESNMITTQEQADAYAIQMRDTHIAGLTVDLRVTCLPIPHVQQGDWVKVANPVVGGQEVELTGMLKSMAQPSNGLVPGRCTVTVTCSYGDVQRVFGGVNRG